MRTLKFTHNTETNKSYVIVHTNFWVPGHVIANLEAEIQQKWAKIRKKANSMVVSEVRAIVFD